MALSHPVKVIAIAGGKGGIGKTNISVNLAIALASLKQRVMLLDADLGLANVDVLLGLSIKKNLSHVLKGECDLSEIIIDGPGNIKIVPAASGIQGMTHLSSAEHAGVVQAFSELQDDLDVLLVDTAAGISDSVVTFCRAAQEVIMIVCNEPTSITDAYASIKVLSQHHQLSHFQVIANMVSDAEEGRELFTRLVRAADRFLDVNLSYCGFVPYDNNLRKAVQRQKSSYLSYPTSGSSLAIKNIAQKIMTWPVPGVPGDHLSFFLERIIQAA